MSSTEIINEIEHAGMGSKASKADINLIGKILRKINIKPDGSPDIGRAKKWRMPLKRKIA